MLDFCHLLWYCIVLQEVANFMDIIKELWYGNVSPFEQCTRGDKQMKDIQMWLGHSDIGTTGNIYSHLDSHSKVQTGVAIYDALTD